MICVTPYEKPDLDGFACAIAYAELLRHQGGEAEACITGTPHPEAQYIMETYKFAYPRHTHTADSQVILVDASTLAGLPKTVNPMKVIEIIDHRQINEVKDFPKAKTHIEFVGAAATLIAEKFRYGRLQPSTMTATLLYGAIISNTLNFQAKLTTNRDKIAATWLQQQLDLGPDFIQAMFEAKSDLAGSKLKQRFDQDFGKFIFGDWKVGVVQLEMLHVKKFWKEREAEILKELEAIKKKHKLNTVFLTCIDLEEGFNLFVSTDAKTQGILKETVGVLFDGNHYAFRDGVIMRKEIRVLLQRLLIPQVT